MTQHVPCRVAQKVYRKKDPMVPVGAVELQKGLGPVDPSPEGGIFQPCRRPGRVALGSCSPKVDLAQSVSPRALARRAEHGWPLARFPCAAGQDTNC
eukprot:351781-Chlamydomonas_euryale.AAC.2